MMLIDDTTIDNFDNMTCAQIKALEQQKMQESDNLTLAEIKSLRQQKMHERENMTLAQARSEMVGSGYRCPGKMRPFPRGNSFGFRGGDFPTFMGGHFGLLMDDISTEELNNITLAEIRDMRTQKIQELENMTIAEIEALKQKRIDELSKIYSFRAQRISLGMHGATMGFAGTKHNWNDERHGRLA